MPNFNNGADLAPTPAENTPEPAAVHEGQVSPAEGAPAKPKPSYAPVYCAMYPELATIARRHGYALAIHGSLQRDFDLVCIPWVDSPSEPDAVVDAFLAKFAIKRIGEMHKHPHGRMVQTISIGWGECAIDLGFMPRLAPATSGDRHSVDSIPNRDLVKRAVISAHRHGPAKARRVHVAEAFALGSTFAGQLCRRFGLDPDERVGTDRRRGDS